MWPPWLQRWEWRSMWQAIKMHFLILTRCTDLIIQYLSINLLFSRLGMEIFQPNCWGNYSDLLEKIPVTPRSRCEKEVLKLFTNFLIFLVSRDVCLGPGDCPCPTQLIMRIFCRSVQCVFLWQDLMNEVDTASVGSFNFPNFLNMMLRLSPQSSNFLFLLFQKGGRDQCWRWNQGGI